MFNEGIKKYVNVLTKKEQKALLKLINIKLRRIPNCPGLQTDSDLHSYKELSPLIERLKEYVAEKFIINKCWANHTDGEYVNWHQHQGMVSVVYYLKNKEEIGTIFLNKDKIVRTKGPENSLIIFKDRLHSVPPRKKGNPKINRYSVALELSF